MLAAQSGFNGQTALIVFAGGGRIGTGLCRRWLRASQVSDNLRMLAVVRGKPEDYIHGTILSDIFNDRVWMRGNPYFDTTTNTLYTLNKDGRMGSIKFVEHDGKPEELNWGRKENEHAILLEASGKLTDPKKCQGFIKAKVADLVMVTAPLKGVDVINYPHIVFGVNEEASTKSDLISWATCTTNGAWLPWYVLISKLSNLKVLAGKLLTVHAVTNTQNPLAKSVKDSKSQTTLDSIIPTTTGFASAGGLVMYWLANAGREIDADIHFFDEISGSALRVPTSTCSIIDQTAVIQTNTPLDKYNLNALFLAAAKQGNLAGNLGFTLDPAVTSKVLIGEERTSIILGAQTEATPLGNNRYFVSWQTFYDNEAGYVAQGWSTLAFVLAANNWGYLETSRLSNWASLFTHFDPRLNLTLESLNTKNVYSRPGSFSDLSEAEIRDFLKQQAQTTIVDPRPYTETGGRILSFKKPGAKLVSPANELEAMARWFDDYEYAYGEEV